MSQIRLLTSSMFLFGGDIFVGLSGVLASESGAARVMVCADAMVPNSAMSNLALTLLSPMFASQNGSNKSGYALRRPGE